MKSLTAEAYLRIVTVLPAIPIVIYPGNLN